MLQILTTITGDNQLTTEEKEEKTVAALNAASPGDIKEIASSIVSSNNDIAAAYLSAFLSVVQKFGDEKILLVRHGFQNPEFFSGTFGLIKFMPPVVIEEIKKYYIENPTAENIESAMYEVAKFFPAAIRDIAHTFSDTNLKLHLYNGAPDGWLEQVYGWYKQSAQPQHLQMMAWIKTPKSVAILKELYSTLKGHDKEDAAIYLQSSGVDADSNTSTIFSPCYAGFVVAGNESENKMGQGYERQVPCCAICNKPAVRLITIGNEKNTLGLKAKVNPSFFLQICGHHASDLIVHIKETENEGILTPMETNSQQASLFEQAVALLLQPHANQNGTGFIEIPGCANHQVGGYPSWITPDVFPVCPLCKSRMKLLVQVDSGLTPFGRLPYSGKVFGFWCDECGVSVTKHQIDD